MDYKIFVINPGSTSDELAYFEGPKKVFGYTARYNPSDLKEFEGKKITAQYEFRRDSILKFLKDKNIDPKTFDAVIGRGGLIKPIPSGTYAVNDDLYEDLSSSARGDHASNLGGLLAREIAQFSNAPAFIADPVVVDELEPLARYSGMPDNPRISIFHALNQKRVARLAADKLGRKYEDCNFIVMHAGGGASVGAHCKGRVIDVNNALDGDGPFTPERSGGVPSGGLSKLCYSGRYTETEMKLKIKGKGGLIAYTGTSNLIAIEKFIDTGEKDEKAGISASREQVKAAVEAMGYQLAKEIGAMSVVLKGKVDAIIFTGGVAYDKHVTAMIKDMVGHIAPIMEFPGGDESAALRDAALRALEDKSIIKQYTK